MQPRILPPHGGYRGLRAYQMAELVYDATVKFCERFFASDRRQRDQMVQAARSGKQNIAEGSSASGTSKKMEIKLIGVARASQEELLNDYLDFLRQRQLFIWDKDDPRSKKIRALAYVKDRSYSTYKTYVEGSKPEVSANTILCLIHQANFLLDRLKRELEERFLSEGGITERLYTARTSARTDARTKERQ